MRLLYETTKTTEELKGSIKRYILSPDENWRLLVKIDEYKGNYRMSHEVGRQKVYFTIDLSESGIVKVDRTLSGYDIINLCVAVFMVLAFTVAFMLAGDINITDILKFNSMFLLVFFGVPYLWCRFYTLRHVDKFVKQMIL